MIEIVKDKIDEIISLLENTGYFLINQRERKDYNVFTKADGSLLTELDLASDMLIKNELHSLFGNIEVLSEENDEKDNIEISKQQYFLLLDPIDGTASFHHGGEFTINLAFCIDREPVVSFIHNPVKKTLIFGDKSNVFKKQNGAIKKIQSIRRKNDNCLNNNGNDKSIKLSCGLTMAKNMELMDKLRMELEKNGFSLRYKDIKPAPALGKLLRFAEGECDAFICASCSQDWDTLVCTPLLSSLKVFYSKSNPKVFFNDNFKQGYFIVANDELLFESINDCFL